MKQRLLTHMYSSNDSYNWGAGMNNLNMTEIEARVMARYAK